MAEKMLSATELKRVWQVSRRRKASLYRSIAISIRQIPTEQAMEFGRWWFDAIQGITPNDRGFVILFRAIMERWPRTQEEIDELICILREVRMRLTMRSSACPDERRRERNAVMRCESVVIHTLLRIQPW